MKSIYKSLFLVGVAILEFIIVGYLLLFVTFLISFESRRIPNIINDTDDRVDIEIVFHRWTEISITSKKTISPKEIYNPKRFSAYCYYLTIDEDRRELNAETDANFKGWQVGSPYPWTIRRTLKVSKMWEAANESKCRQGW